MRKRRALSRAAFVAVCALAASFLAGCETEQSASAPESWTGSSHWPRATYYTVVVHDGDTVSQIAARYNVSAYDLAHANNISAMDGIRPGEVLRVPPTHSARSAVLREATNNRLAPAPDYRKDRVIVRNEPDIAPRTHRVPQSEQRVASLPQPAPRMAPQIASTPQIVHSGEDVHAATGAMRFVTPVDGKVIAVFGSFGNGQRNDGINIAASAGAPIHASAEGTVTYTGNELKGYGNLILIKHDGGYFTTYAHVQTISVARNQHVSKGDVIGTVGQTGDVDQPQLHFEIRDGLRPIDPAPLLLAARES